MPNTREASQGPAVAIHTPGQVMGVFSHRPSAAVVLLLSHPDDMHLRFSLGCDARMQECVDSMQFFFREHAVLTLTLQRTLEGRLPVQAKVKGHTRMCAAVLEGVPGLQAFTTSPQRLPSLPIQHSFAIEMRSNDQASSLPPFPHRRSLSLMFVLPSPRRKSLAYSVPVVATRMCMDA